MQLHLEIVRLGSLGDAGRQALTERIAGNVFLEDLFGSLTFNKVGRGHLTGQWSRVNAVAPELAKAFEKWLDSVLSKE